MEKYYLNNDLKVFGTQVKTFPEGIGAAFEALIKMLPDGPERQYYGISYMTKDGEIIYKATVLEKYEGEAKKYHCEISVIEKGEYLTEVIHDWRKKTDCIKDVFHDMMQDSRIDKSKPCVEWYKNSDEMFCMVKLK